jgi:hypothetical protein
MLRNITEITERGWLHEVTASGPLAVAGSPAAFVAADNSAHQLSGARAHAQLALIAPLLPRC